MALVRDKLGLLHRNLQGVLGGGVPCPSLSLVGLSSYLSLPLVCSCVGVSSVLLFRSPVLACVIRPGEAMAEMETEE